MNINWFGFCILGTTTLVYTTYTYNNKYKVHENSNKIKYFYYVHSWIELYLFFHNNNKM